MIQLRTTTTRGNNHNVLLDNAKLGLVEKIEKLLNNDHCASDA